MGQPEWLTPKAKKQRQNRRSGKHEREVARTIGGKVQAGSGSSWRARGDVKNATHLIEHKFTEKESYSVKLSTWRNLQAIALDCGKQPAFVIHFGPSDRSPAIVITEYQE